MTLRQNDELKNLTLKFNDCWHSMVWLDSRGILSFSIFWCQMNEISMNRKVYSGWNSCRNWCFPWMASSSNLCSTAYLHQQLNSFLQRTKTFQSYILDYYFYYVWSNLYLHSSYLIWMCHLRRATLSPAYFLGALQRAKENVSKFYRWFQSLIFSSLWHVSLYMTLWKCSSTGAWKLHHSNHIFI